MCSDFFEISANINAIIVYKAKKKIVCAVLRQYLV